MLQLMNDMPAGVLGIRAIGKVSADDYINVVFPAFTEYAKTTSSFKYLLLLETHVSNFSAEAWVNDAVLGFQYFTKWKKSAVVTSQQSVIMFTNIFSRLVPGEYKGFKLSELVHARQWLAD